MSRLPAGEAALVRASAAVAAWSLGRAERDDVAWALRMAAEDAEPGAVEEALLQCYLFLGYPAALNALALWRQVSGRPPAGGGAHQDPASWARRGQEVCRRVYAGQYEALRENVRRLHPDMERWMVEEGYGKVLGRSGLELRLRELCIVAVLAASPWPTQLYSHLRGALNAGAHREEVESALEIALAMATEDERTVARATWERVEARSRGGAARRVGEGPEGQTPLR